MTSTANKPTIILTHAAWADGSSWSKVILPLQAAGFNVYAAQIPLTGLHADIAALKQLLARVSGPVILVGHSYAGAVITAAASGNPTVGALVYIAGMAPDEGESVGTLFHRAAPHAQAPALSPDADGLLWLPPDAFANAVAPDSSVEETAVMQAAQKPIAIACLGETMGIPAWREKPSWFLIAGKDRMISPDTQRFMAERAKSRIRALEVDHTPISSAPHAVVDIIVEAAKATS